MGDALSLIVLFVIVSIVASLSKSKTAATNQAKRQAMNQNAAKGAGASAAPPSRPAQNSGMQSRSAASGMSAKPDAIGPWAAKAQAKREEIRARKAREAARSGNVAPAQAGHAHQDAARPHLPHAESAPFEQGGEGNEGPGYHPCLSHEEENAPVLTPLPRFDAAQLRQAVIAKEILDRPVSQRQRRFAR